MKNKIIDVYYLLMTKRKQNLSVMNVFTSIFPNNNNIKNENKYNYNNDSTEDFIYYFKEFLCFCF